MDLTNAMQRSIAMKDEEKDREIRVVAVVE